MHSLPIRLPLRARAALVRTTLVVVQGVLVVTVLTGCRGGGDARDGDAADTRSAIAGMFSQTPDELPVMINAEPPFRYPAALYPQRVQGDVILRLFVDSSGVVVPDSTRVQETSGNATLDSAALAGVRELRFTPARRRGTAMAVSLLYPVYFRHPEAQPLPGDSLPGKP